MSEDSSQEKWDHTLEEISIYFYKKIGKANNRLELLYNHYVVNTHIAYWITIILFLLVSIILLLIISISLYITFQPSSSWFMQIFSVAGILIGTISVVIVLLNHPLRSVKRPLLEMMKIGIIYSGYIRQIYQIDAEFRKNLLNSESQKELRDLEKQTQKVIDQVVQNLSIAFDEPFD